MNIKKIIAAVSICLAITTVPAFASNLTTVYNLTEQTRISTGITHENIKKLTTNGWMNINIVRVNLNDEYTSTKPIYSSNGVSNRDHLSTMIASSGAVAGINGDFFYMGSPTYSYGPIISDGNIMSSPLPANNGTTYPTMSLGQNGNIDISVWNPKISITAVGSHTYNLTTINKISALNYDPFIINKYYGKQSIGNTCGKDIVEIVVENNYVTEVRENMPPRAIPEDGYILVCASWQKSAVMRDFPVGQEAELKFIFDFDINNLNWAVGGVNYLVKDGQVFDISSEVLGRHPRTAVGFNKDNSEAIFVTIDGRNKNYIGATQTELAQIMQELGAYNVVNMDGGGSTTMGVDFLQNGKVEIVNFPSDGGERYIASGLGVFNSAPESDEIATLTVKPQYDKIFKNTSVKLSAAAINPYYVSVDLKNKAVTYSVDESYGTIKGDVFTPSKAGDVKITATVEGVSADCIIKVLDKPVALKFEKDYLVMDGNEQYTFRNIMGIDKDGNSAYISPKNITWTCRNSVGKVDENGVFTANDVSNTGALTASCGDAISNITIKVGYRLKTLERFEEFKNFKFTTYPENSNGCIELTNESSKEGDYSLKLNYDFTNMTDQSIAFVELGENANGIKLDGQPKGIGMWVYGDGSTHWLRVRITDASGKQHKIDLAEEVNWQGWKWVSCKFPAGISYPVTLKNIYLAEINETKKDTGSILIDNLRVLYEPNDKDLNLKEETYFVDSLKVNSPASYEQLVRIDNDNITKDSKEGTSVVSPLVVAVNITNGSISPTNTTMWANIKNIVYQKDRNIILSFNQNPANMGDYREQQALNEILKKANENNNIFVTWKGATEETTIVDGIRSIQYNDTFEMYVTKDSVSYKN